MDDKKEWNFGSLNYQFNVENKECKERSEKLYTLFKGINKNNEIDSSEVIPIYVNKEWCHDINYKTLKLFIEKYKKGSLKVPINTEINNQNDNLIKDSQKIDSDMCYLKEIVNLKRLERTNMR